MSLSNLLAQLIAIQDLIGVTAGSLFTARSSSQQVFIPPKSDSASDLNVDMASETALIATAVQELYVFWTDMYYPTVNVTWQVHTLLVYEWSITVGEEIELFWNAPLTGATVLFLINRYCPILNWILSWLPVLNTELSCRIVASLGYGLAILQYAPWAGESAEIEPKIAPPFSIAAFAAIRAYAISDRRWSLAALVWLFSCMPIVVNLVQTRWLSVDLKAILPPPFEILCAVGEKDMPILVKTMSSLIISDGIVIAVTWLTMRRTIQLSEIRVNEPSFSRVFLVNGKRHRAVLLCLNVLDFILAILQITEQVVQGGGSYVILFVEPMTTILISRFLLELQAVRRRTQHQSSLGSNSEASIIVQRAIGCMDCELPGPGSSLDVSEGDGPTAHRQREDEIS
ncbi:hypothetical protein C8Q80DRAFT_1212300 [Daedaleopsis nitida]|nr:hypothetical protein C8Q80DRAFT_1212300 [Daedaleopsis nitida]